MKLKELFSFRRTPTMGLSQRLTLLKTNFTNTVYELKNYTHANTYILGESLRQINESQSDERLAVVTVLPPVESGVASCTASTFAAAPYGVDYFSSFNSVFDYLETEAEQARGNGRNRIFSLDTLPVAARKVKYRGIVFVIANSSHNFPIAMTLRRMNNVDYRIPTFVHLHDPYVPHIVNLIFGNIAYGYRNRILAEYNRLPAEYATRRISNRLLAEAKISGLKALISDLRIDGIIVNSEAARRIVRDDYPQYPDERIHTLFHPIFGLSDSRPKKLPGHPVIGSFGVPNSHKRTDTVIEAFERFKSAGHQEATLALIGYNAEEYSATHGLLHRRDILAVSPMSTGEFDGYIRAVDAAVQLRKANTGESSGVVARLLAAGKPTIVSPVGSFLELGDAVALAPENHDPARLAQMLDRAVSEPEERRASMERIVADRAPERFCERLWRLIPESEAALGRA